MGLLSSLFGKKTIAAPQNTNPAENHLGHRDSFTVPTEKLMTSQLPALYIKEKNQAYHDIYIKKLLSIGFNKSNAEKMFQFESYVISRYGKQYLQHPQFTKSWFFDLRQPFFVQYPKTKEEILKEKYLTMSEICKIIDEAEWHYWNSHEMDLSDEVWAEIYAWHLRGPGAEFATIYFDMIAKETGIPSENISSLCALQGEHLRKYKWR